MLAQKPDLPSPASTRCPVKTMSGWTATGDFPDKSFCSNRLRACEGTCDHVVAVAKSVGRSANAPLEEGHRASGYRAAQPGFPVPLNVVSQDFGSTKFSNGVRCRWPDSD